MSKRVKRHEQPVTHMPLTLEYYQLPFMLLLSDLTRQGYDPSVPHPLRKQYWGLIIPKEYKPAEARSWVLQYAKRLEEELASVLKEHSLAYWLHIYRRLAPNAIGRQKDPETIHITRLTLEAAIQKYGKLTSCNGIALSSEVSIDRVMNGIFLSEELKHIRIAIETMPQFVLTDFGVHELRVFIDAERLAYELWRSGAMLRIISKGASIIVDDSEDVVYDLRDDALDTLVKNFDKRGGEINLLSTKGVVNSAEAQGRGAMLLHYNVNHVPFALQEEYYLKAHNLRLSYPPDSYPNFLWLPFALQNFLARHQPFSGAFLQKHNVSLAAVVTIIAALHISRYEWVQDNPMMMVRLAQRGYRGPATTKQVIEALLSYKEDALDYLGILEEISDEEYVKAIDFWTLKLHDQAKIDTSFPGPHYIFLPYDEDKVFIDYAWITRRLMHLFFDLAIDNENFKADFLETLVRKELSPLPYKPCKASDGTSKQIDASFQIGKRLVIVECKAQAHSIAFFRGDPLAIPHRQRNVDAALREIDAKADWLVKHPQGNNYDISSYTEILPVVVTPFTEYIPSLEQRYWLKPGFPRVMTPTELTRAMEEGFLAGEVLNLRSSKLGSVDI